MNAASKLTFLVHFLLLLNFLIAGTEISSVDRNHTLGFIG